MDFPFNPIERSEEVEKLVTKDSKRSYYRFRSAPYYGGIATADAVGCSFLCAYCWNYNRNLHPERFREFYSPQQVASKLLYIANKKSHRLFRISGAEPVLGERTFLHLIEVLRLILQNKTDSLFILETNGFFLGRRLDLLKNLKPYPNLRIRICLKGTDEDSFEKITGAKKKFFRYPIMALRELLKLEVRAWPALMGDIFSRDDIDRLEKTLKEQDIHVDLELELLESYPFVLDNMRKRKIKI
jgi:uncharacterized Fe-S cluster-containing radical SAM superfamily protein